MTECGHGIKMKVYRIQGASRKDYVALWGIRVSSFWGELQDTMKERSWEKIGKIKLVKW